jgi:hypothetical protein
MLFDWVLLLAFLGGAVFVLASARRLADRPRTGTAWRPSYRTYLLVAAALFLGALGALLDIVGS